MSDYPTRLRTLLRLTILFCCALNVVSKDTNVTVADTDNSITYQPPSSWHSSTNLCASCLDPKLSTTFHEGIHEAIGPDPDDQHEEHEKEEKAKKDGKGPGRRRSFQRRFEPLPRDDPDDGAPDPAVEVSFNFTGSAVYVFGIIPPTILNVNSTSPNVNLTIFLDDKKIPDSPVALAASRLATFQPNQTVFSLTGLSESPHHLVISLGPNSTFIFQSLTYTHDVAETSSPTDPSPSLSSPSTPSTSTQSSPSPKTESNSKHNVATFAGAVGGGVGVLALFSFGLALSICIRRRKSVRRDRQDHESLHTNASDDSPAMSGPAPFVPRYFPDTIIPTDPPTYNTALATSNINSTLLARLTPAALMATPTEEDEEDRSYADVPPAMPPPPVEDLAAMLRRPPPPPFPAVAPTTPPPPGIFVQRPEGALLPPIVPGVAAPAYDANERPSVAVDVGTEPLPSILPPEQVPLLQAVDAADPIAPIVPTSRVQTPAPIASSGSSMYARDAPDLPESRTMSSSEPLEAMLRRENVS